MGIAPFSFALSLTDASESSFVYRIDAESGHWRWCVRDFVQMLTESQSDCHVTISRMVTPIVTWWVRGLRQMPMVGDSADPKLAARESVNVKHRNFEVVFDSLVFGYF
jgi:hypothetical protein